MFRPSAPCAPFTRPGLLRLACNQHARDPRDRTQPHCARAESIFHASRPPGSSCSALWAAVQFLVLTLTACTSSVAAVVQVAEASLKRRGCYRGCEVTLSERGCTVHECGCRCFQRTSLAETDTTLSSCAASSCILHSSSPIKLLVERVRTLDVVCQYQFDPLDPDKMVWRAALVLPQWYKR